ncbi:C-C motif chemokine 3 Macrophage inflammatory protein 1-alpha [Channa argus]|uniref:C-C motif chemokine 3 Macrophage inflammatory protein 1-alpha n=1 Tax=Channa argus TaxID=215402 RepID=A0A6G1PGV8_CHAAH|nr:C-C motif chemokine 3 Macrophage inflammatory protein 1-alpha [Channa argus]KAK2918285.1 hypothetical protein Q8A73_005031 [Channa argus]
MKTLCFTLGLLLLTVCYCDAVGDAASLSATPVDCCFKFYGSPIPHRFISGITKSHRSCQNQGFIVSTVRGLKFCYKDTYKWALDTYNKAQQPKAVTLKM